MNKQPNNHRITVNICGAEPFKLPLDESEELLYRQIIERINSNCNRFRYGADADSEQVALAKVALYYAMMFYRRHETLSRQADLLNGFEEKLDKLIQQFDSNLTE